MSVIQLESSETLSTGTGETAEARMADPVIPLRRRIAPVFACMSRLGWMLVDSCIGAAAAAAAYQLTPHARLLMDLPRHLAESSAILLLGIFVAFTARIFGLSDRLGRHGVLDLLIRCLLVTSMAVAGLVVVSNAVFYRDIGRHIIGWTVLITFTGLCISRALSWHYAARHPERVGLVGDQDFLHMARRHLEKSGRPVILHCLDIAGAAPSAIRSLSDWAVDKSVDEVVYGEQPSQPMQAALLRCLDRGVRVGSFPAHMERRCESVPLEMISHEWFLTDDMGAMRPGYVIFKRIIDISLASLGLLLASPLLILAVIAIRLESPGPAFYSQVRVGLRNRNFRIWKLRSMRTDAESNGAQWAQKKDSRVTRIGRILRKTRLDEVPQFFNILRGDMGFIGPRPERPEFVDQLAEAIPYYRQRHLVKPGLTGWAQINADYGSSISDAEDKLRYDLYYLKHGSVEFDLHICIRTIGAIMRGAR